LAGAGGDRGHAREPREGGFAAHSARVRPGVRIAAALIGPTPRCWSMRGASSSTRVRISCSSAAASFVAASTRRAQRRSASRLARSSGSRALSARNAQQRRSKRTRPSRPAARAAPRDAHLHAALRARRRPAARGRPRERRANPSSSDSAARYVAVARPRAHAHLTAAGNAPTRRRTSASAQAPRCVPPAER
jgi:hypothetical protein